MLETTAKPMSIGLALDVCLAIKRLFQANSSFAQLPCLLNSLLINIVFFFLPHSLPLNALLLLYVVTQIKCGSPLIWLSVKSRSDFPKLCVFTLFQLRLALALLYTVCQCLIILQFSTCRQCRPKSAICTKRSCDIVFMKMKVI